MLLTFCKRFLSKKIFALASMLVLSPGFCFSMLWFVSDALGTNEYYFLVTGHYYDDLVNAKIPEYDQLNDKLMDDLPVYPDTEIIAGTERRGGPGIPALGAGPGGPRILKICYMADAPVNDVMDFYKRELEERDWQLTRIDNWARMYVEWTFFKEEACVEIGNECSCVIDPVLPNQCPSATYEPKIYPTTYELTVYYNLNKLLGFPGVPEGGCP